MSIYIWRKIVYFNYLIFPGLALALLLAKYFITNDMLRQTIMREIKDIFC